MNGREKILALVIVGLAALFAVDRLVVAPVTTAFAEVAEETQELEAELTEARAMVNSRAKIERRRSAYRLAGLDTALDAARIRVQVHVTEWSQECGLQVNALSSGRVVRGETYDRLSFTLTGVGRLSSIHRFLLETESAGFPLRITDCTIARRGDDSDELTLSLNLSTVVTAGAEDERLARAEVTR